MASLFSEITIAGKGIKNRIVMPPMVCFSFAPEDGNPTQENVEHYEARAKGGVGLIIVEATCVDEKGRLAPKQLGLWSDYQIDGFSKIAEVCHNYDARVMVQIHHGGLMTAKGVTDDVVAPSAYQSKAAFPRGEVSARAMTINEIHDLQEKFVAAAVRAQKAGLDGVELHGAHGYLISQFFSPLVNHRNDAYGGSLTKRTRFAVEVIKTIRKATGKGFIIGCRMGCNEPNLEGSILIAQALQKAGVDLLHVSSGFVSSPMMGSQEPEAPEGFPFSWVVYGGSEIKKKVNVPVIVVRDIKTPDQASDIVGQGLADFAAIGKGLLVDPEWANKAQKHLEVVPCIGCKVCSYFRPNVKCPQQS